MELIDVEIIPTYSCQVCHKEFTREGEVLIEQNIQPTCSPECRFKVLRKIIGSYNNGQLKEMLSVLLPNYKPKRRSEAIKRLASVTLIKMQEAIE
jgi:NAD-dependent SIR2 family protein deacetylase